jgi:hypothetical protein
MGVGNTLLVIGLILGALWLIFPEDFSKGVDTTWDKIQDIRSSNSEPDYTLTTEGKDYGKIYGHLDCVMDSDCEQAFEMEDLICTDEGTCLMVTNNG